MHKLPDSASRISSSVGCGLSASSSWLATIMPGVQKPHCSPKSARNAACNGLSPSGGVSPSMVVTARPSSCAANSRQLRAERPSTSTVHAPHTPCSQPTCVPRRRRSWRRKSARERRPSTRRSTLCPFTVSRTSYISSVSSLCPFTIGSLLSRFAGAIRCSSISGLQQYLLSQDGDQVLAVGGRGVHIGRRRRHGFGSGFTCAASTVNVDRTAKKSAFGPDQPHRSIAHAEGHQARRLTDICTQAHGCRDSGDGEVAWAPGHFGKAPRPTVLIGH